MATTTNNNTEAVVEDEFFRSFPRIGFYRFEFAAEEPVQLPAYPGSAWRGLLGHGLRRTVCVTRQPTCTGCLLAGTCVYSSIFESPPRDPDPGGRYTAVPHPYALVVDVGHPQECQPGQDFGFGFHLFGEANKALPYLVHAMTLVGDKGIGRGHGRFRLVRLMQRSAPEHPWQEVFSAGSGLHPLPEFQPVDSAHDPAPEAITMRLRSPLRIKRNGHLVGPSEFRFEAFLRQLVWRLNDLARWYGSPDQTVDWRRVAPAAEQLTEQCALRWRDWTRYSSRQEASMQMGGLVGEITLSGPGLTPLWPLLRLGQWVSLGKATSMGLGQYVVEPAASLPEHPGRAPAATITSVGSQR